MDEFENFAKVAAENYEQSLEFVRNQTCASIEEEMKFALVGSTLETMLDTILTAQEILELAAEMLVLCNPTLELQAFIDLVGETGTTQEKLSMEVILALVTKKMNDMDLD